MTLAKVLFALSFLLPYLIDYASFEDFQQLVIYAPVWVFGLFDGQIFGGPTPMAFLLFFYWTPIVVSGYMAYRFAKGNFSRTSLYILSVIICIIISVVFILPMASTPRAAYEGVTIYSTAVPFPIAPLLDILLIPFLRPKVVTSPWKENESEMASQSETEEETHWLD